MIYPYDIPCAASENVSGEWICLLTRTHCKQYTGHCKKYDPELPEILMEEKSGE